MEGTKLTIKYKEVGGFELGQVIQKIASTPTSTSKAAAIRKLVKAVQEVRVKAADEWKEQIFEKYSKRDDKGVIVRPKDDPNGFEPDETRAEEMHKAQTEFDNKLAELSISPLNPMILSDVKLSAADLERLGALFSEEAGPGIPGGLQAIR